MSNTDIDRYEKIRRTINHALKNILKTVNDNFTGEEAPTAYGVAASTFLVAIINGTLRLTLQEKVEELNKIYNTALEIMVTMEKFKEEITNARND